MARPSVVVVVIYRRGELDKAAPHVASRLGSETNLHGSKKGRSPTICRIASDD